MQPTAINRNGKLIGYRVEIVQGEAACKLFAIREFAKVVYSIRMLESGRTMGNNDETVVKVRNIKQIWNNKVLNAKVLAEQFAKATTKSKQVLLETYRSMQWYFNIFDPLDEIPDDFDWVSYKF